MPILRVVPGPADEPEAVAVTVAAPALETTVSDGIPIRWFSCADRGVGAVVRAHVLTVLNAWVVDTDTIADAMVLVSELVTNVRDHTASDSLGVRVSLTPERVVVAVVEPAPSEAPPEGRLLPGPLDHAASTRPLHDRGRGLRILDAVSSEWGFVRTDGRTTTWFALLTRAASLREPDVRRF